MDKKTFKPFTNHKQAHLSSACSSGKVPTNDRCFDWLKLKCREQKENRVARAFEPLKRSEPWPHDQMLSRPEIIKVSFNVSHSSFLNL